MSQNPKPRKALFAWTDAFAMGYPPMDRTHQEFVELVDAILMSADATMLERIDAFADHARRHFAEEAEWMTGTGFPAAQCHIDEHEAVLKSVVEVRGIIADGGDTEVARSLAAELMRWFPGHTDYMDSALAQWMVKRSHGGAPIVFHRD
ncbi:MAG: hemerythrin domain-containing protein [Nevskiales bacterium]|nr:hemerythrin domain-containing protein [Nevskiales bacterium]